LKSTKTKKLKLKLKEKRREKLAMPQKIPIPKVIDGKFFELGPKLL
tara:strand:- start:469 stop:606 length:138 start_codon:yes stop_codon:yes gene_type:complete